MLNKRLLYTTGDSVLFFFNLYLEQIDNSFEGEKISLCVGDRLRHIWEWLYFRYFHFSNFGLKSHKLSVSAKFMILCAFWDSWHLGYLPWFRFQHVVFDCLWSTYERDHQDKLLLSVPKHCCINIWWLLIFSWSNFRSYVTGIFNMFALITF